MNTQQERIDIHRLVIPEAKKTSADFSFDPELLITQQQWDFLELKARQVSTLNQFENSEILSALKAISPRRFASWGLPTPNISFFNPTESLRADIELNKATEYRFCYPKIRDAIMPHSTLEDALDTLKDNEWIQLANDVDILGLGPKGIQGLSLCPKIVGNLTGNTRNLREPLRIQFLVLNLAKLKVISPEDYKKFKITEDDWSGIRKKFNDDLSKATRVHPQLIDEVKIHLLQSALRFSLAIKTLAAKDIKFTESGFEFIMEEDNSISIEEKPLPEQRRF